MGAKSKPRSTAETTAKNQNLNAQGNTAPVSVPSVEVRGGKYTRATVNQDLSKEYNYDYDLNVTNTVTDFGAVRGAIDLSKSALNNYEKINKRAIDKISDSNGDVIGLAKSSNNGVLEFAGSAIAEVSKAMRSDDAENYNNLIKWVVIGGVLIMGVGAFKK